MLLLRVNESLDVTGLFTEPLPLTQTRDTKLLKLKELELKQLKLCACF